MLLIGKAVQLVAPVSANMAANITSLGLCLDNVQELSLHAFWTGTPAGNLDIQISNDPVPVGAPGLDPAANVVNWSTLSGATQAAGGAPGNFNWGLSFCRYGFLRLIFTQSSSTGLLTVNARIWSNT